MPSTKLTKRTIDAIPFSPEGAVLYRDAELTGFGLRVGSRSKTFFAESQVRRRTVRMTLGRYPLLTPDEARRMAMTNLAAMSQGVDLVKEKKAELARSLTVAEAFETFFEAKPNLSPATVESYGRTVRLYLSDWRKLPLQEVTRDMVLARHRKISKDRGPITANAAFRHFRSVFNFVASLHETFPNNPVQVLSKARVWARERRRQTVVSVHQLPAWWNAVMAEDTDPRDFLLIALFTGMRRSEIAALQWEHVDLVAQTLQVPKTKNGDPLMLPLSAFLAELIGARRELVGQSPWVFPGRGATGHLVETKSFTRRVVKASGVPFSLHDLRRTFITVAESLDIPSYALKRLLNHRTDNEVTGGYIVIGAERLRGPVERVAERIRELTNEECRKLPYN